MITMCATHGLARACHVRVTCILISVFKCESINDFAELRPPSRSCAPPGSTISQAFGNLRLYEYKAVLRIKPLIAPGDSVTKGIEKHCLNLIK